jgi:nucleotide sugar dehydrogenase
MELGVYGGLGIVGGALVKWLEEAGQHTVRIRDPKGRNDDFSSCVAIFIAVPVPTEETTGLQDLSILTNCIEEANALYKGKPIFVRSTVLPGTCDRFASCFGAKVYAMPEFLTERTAHDDMAKLPVLAGVSGHDEAIAILFQVFNPKPVWIASNFEAELAKYTHNCFAALKVNYFNVIKEVCEAYGADYTAVMLAAVMTGFIEPTHTHVPGPDGKYGFGGKCLPKDLHAFVTYLQQRDFMGWTTLGSAFTDNDYFRAKPGPTQQAI